MVWLVKNSRLELAKLGPWALPIFSPFLSVSFFLSCRLSVNLWSWTKAARRVVVPVRVMPWCTCLSCHCARTCHVVVQVPVIWWTYLPYRGTRACHVTVHVPVISWYACRSRSGEHTCHVVVNIPVMSWWTYLSCRGARACHVVVNIPVMLWGNLYCSSVVKSTHSWQYPE